MTRSRIRGYQKDEASRSLTTIWAVALGVLVLAQVASSFIDFGSTDTPAAIDAEDVIPVESKRESFDSIYQRLMPEAQVAVERRTGARLSPRLVIVDQNDMEGVFGPVTAARSVAIRLGNVITVRRHEQVTEKAAFDTLCHEMLHMATNSAAKTGELSPGISLDVLRLAMVFNEAISYRFAAEITAERYGGLPEYDWRNLPRRPDGYPAELAIDLVMMHPNAVLAMTRDLELTKAHLAAFRKAPGTIMSTF